MFADGMTLITEVLEHMKKLLEEVETFSEDIEMKFGTDKCSHDYKWERRLSKQTNKKKKKKKLELLEKELEIVDEYKYLG